MIDSVKNNIELLYVHIAVKFLDLPDLEVKAGFIAMWKMIEEKPRYIPDTVGNAIKSLFTEAGYVDWLNWNIERIVINNYIWGDLEKFTFDQFKYEGITKEDSLIYNILKSGELCMRVNVLHPMFLSDQHLVAEYREVKMGPKALSRSLSSLKGVDKKKISPKYTLNTGHTYFFYDKNKFLEDRLALLVNEMKFRGFATNHTELIDDSYDYHKDTFNDEWWGNWTPDKEALDINMERINQRFHQKDSDPTSKGWYKLFGMPVQDMNSIFLARKNGFVNVICDCNAIVDIDNVILKVDTHCWNCCKPLNINYLRKVYLVSKAKLSEEKTSEANFRKVNPVIDIYELNHWRELPDFLGKIRNEQELDLQKLCQTVKGFIVAKLERDEFNPEEENLEGVDLAAAWARDDFYFSYDEFDLENLFEVLSFIITRVINKREMIDWFLSGIKNQDSKNFLYGTFEQVIDYIGGEFESNNK